MSNPVAAGISRISLLNLTEKDSVQTRIVLEIYDGDNRIQIEFDTVDEFYDVLEKSPDSMMDYFRNNLFESPEMDDPKDALLKMASTSGDEGLVTVPPEDDDEKLFEAMTTIFQKTAELSQSSSEGSEASELTEDEFIQSLLNDKKTNGDQL